jgi:probable phosphomutase (TIGR03848 family)
MTTFLLIRHGDTDAVGRYLAGWKAGCSLNKKGKEQVQRLARRLSRYPIRAVYTSPLERAVETASAIAAPHGLDPQIRPGMGEFRFGQWEGMSLEQLSNDPEWRRFNQCRSRVRAPGGELITETQARMVNEIDDLRNCHPGETVALISHCDPLRSLIAHYLGASLDLFLRLEIHPASVTAVERNASGARILYVNHDAGEIPLELSHVNEVTHFRLLTLFQYARNCIPHT